MIKRFLLLFMVASIVTSGYASEPAQITTGATLLKAAQGTAGVTLGAMGVVSVTCGVGLLFLARWGANKRVKPLLMVTLIGGIATTIAGGALLAHAVVS